MPQTDVKVPDIGDFTDVPVIEVLVKAGDSVKAEDSLVTLESDKATMDVPAPIAGVVKDVRVKVGDKVSEGKVILTLEAAESGEAKSSPPPASTAPAAASADVRDDSAASAPSSAKKESAASDAGAGAPQTIEVKVPDIGDFKDVPVIEVLVKPGDSVKAEDSLVTLESEKATMDVPAPSAGVIREVKVRIGDQVSEGHVIAIVEAAGAKATAPTAPAAAPSRTASGAPGAPSPPPLPQSSAREDAAQSAAAASTPRIDSESMRKAHASPSVRALARELGVNLARVKGTGPKDRVLQEDVQKYVKQVMSGASAAGASAGGAALGLLPWPQIDFTKFGPIEPKPLSRIKKISGANLHRNWVMIPHVTNHDDADITDLEALRVTLNKENERSGERSGEKGSIKVTMLAFLIKVCVSALKKFPEFNSSLDGDNLVFKQYYNVGFAADTPNGLMVPVIKGADQKGVLAIAREMGELSAKAREGKLGPTDMQGGCFSISSLGGIGGTYFTPIINAPEVAILGVCRSTTRPVWDGKQFVPRLILPLSLSYDHRVIDGAAAARFNAYLVSLLGDMRRSLL
jgi:pyruvate dehydrogenase E2 component (dihydrolipoamide acetyltransferase)